MRIYNNVKEAVKETERELVEMGIKLHPETMQDKEVGDNLDFETIELQGYGYKITSFHGLEADFRSLKGNWEYIQAEMSDRLSNTLLNPGNAWLTRQDVWEEFVENKTGRFAYTYNERFREQLPYLIEELREHPNTRQAVMTMYDRHQDMGNMGGIRRIPCSMYYQMLRRVRQGVEKLDLIYTMRSCDFYTHYLYDICLAMKMQEYIANAVGIEPGHFTHFIGSLHAYAKDYTTKGVF